MKYHYGISKYTRKRQNSVKGLQRIHEILTNLRFIKSGIKLSGTRGGKPPANGGLLINNNNNTDTLGYVGVL